MSIIVCPLSRVPALVASHRPSRVVSLLDPGMRFPSLGRAYVDRHLRLSFHDAHVAERGVTIATAADVERLCAFLDAWDAIDPLLVHCHAGIGRSTATAFVSACYLNPDVPERRIAETLRRVAPLARPNEHVVRVADDVLGRGGRMADAIAETGRGLPWIDVPEGVPFELASRYARDA